VFPIFEEQLKPGVLTVFIYNSDLVGLPPFKKEEWDRLRDVVFVNTTRLSCGAIAELRRPGLRVVSECTCLLEPNLPKEDCPTCKEGSTCLATLLVLIIFIILGVGFIPYILRKRQTWTLVEQRQTGV
jgi:hypothetical protein